MRGTIYGFLAKSASGRGNEEETERGGDTHEKAPSVETGLFTITLAMTYSPTRSPE
jgi:hypothetical protein